MLVQIFGYHDATEIIPFSKLLRNIFQRETASRGQNHKIQMILLTWGWGALHDSRWGRSRDGGGRGEGVGSRGHAVLLQTNQRIHINIL